MPVAGQMPVPWNWAPVGPASLCSGLTRDPVGMGYSRGCRLSGTYHAPSPAQDPVFTEPGNYEPAPFYG